MKLFNEHQYRQLLENGQPENRDKDHPPVVQVTMPFTDCVWLLSELDPEEPDIAFGLCDLGFGFPELGSVSISEITSVTHPVFPGVGAYCNPLFEGKYPMSVYADAARSERRIVWDDAILQRFTKKAKGSPKPE